MADKKSTKKQKDTESRVGEVAEQLEYAFMAGLGALSDAQKKGAARFESLVKEGEKFRKKATSKSESLIDDVRDKSQLDKLQDAFDTRVADTMDRLNVPSKNDIDAINKKLNKIVRLLEGQGKPAAKKKVTRKAAKKKPAAKKKAAKKTRKTTK